MRHTHFPDIIQHDNNLLIALYFFIKLQNVSRVAQELNISQSAASHKLAKLRRVFGDPLLIKTYQGMMLTPLAEQLMSRVEPIVFGIEQLYKAKHTATRAVPTKRVYRVCVPDDDIFNVLTVELFQLIDEYALEEPVVFEVFSRYDRCMEDLNAGKIDLFPGHSDAVGSAIKRAEAGTMTYSLAVNTTHPLANQIVAPATLSSLPYVDMMFSERIYDITQTVYSDILKTMTLKMRVSSLSSIVALIKREDVIAFLPDTVIDEQQLARITVNGRHLSVQGYLYWHEAMDKDPFHRRLRHDLLARVNPNRRQR